MVCAHPWARAISALPGAELLAGELADLVTGRPAEQRRDREDGRDRQQGHPPARTGLRRPGEEALEAGDPLVSLVIDHLLDVRQGRAPLRRALPRGQRLVVLEAVDQVVLGAVR